MIRRLLPLGLVVLLALSCNRHVDPYVPGEKPAAPDLSRIFPEGARRAAAEAKTAASQPPASPAGSAPAGAQASNGTGPVSGTIELASSLAGRVPQGAVLFLIARREGSGGPPVAVERIADPHFPLRFEIGPSNRMIQAVPFAGPFRISARVDSDGDASTRAPNDLVGTAPGTYQPGDTGVHLVIDRTVQQAGLVKSRSAPFAAGGAPEAQGAASSVGSSQAAPIRGTIALAPALAGQVPHGAVLFLVARRAGSQGGPPLAVKRVAAPHFPLKFSIGPNDRIIQAFPFVGPIQLTARVDSDGNAMTRSPGDLVGKADAAHQPGDSGVRILIDRKL